MQVVPADRCSFNDWRQSGRFRSFIEPAGAYLDGTLGECLIRFGHENPIVAYYRRSRKKEVRKFSDFVTRPQLHRLALYNEYYREIDIEHQVVVPLSLGSTRREVGFALSRRRIDFSARDHALLRLVQPHLIQAHRNARAVGRLWMGRGCLESIVEGNGQAALLLSRTGAVRIASLSSRRLLGEYFGEDGGRSGRVPEGLASWLARETRMPAEEAAIGTPRRPLVVAREGKRLTIHLVENGDERILLLEERADTIDPAAFAALGLTQRQSEVLALVTQGKTNAEIASALGARPATVAKHLEGIYKRLNVESRTAAAARAFEVSRAPGQAPLT